MAGDWIKMRTNLWDDPRVARLCDLTDSSEAAVVGALYWLWATADDHSADGILAGLSLRAIDRKTGVPGIGKALVSIGWLVEHDDGVALKRFGEHNGVSAKTRAQTARRVAKHKGNADSTNESQEGNAETVSGPLPREREELEKEKDSKPSNTDVLLANGDAVDRSGSASEGDDHPAEQVVRPMRPPCPHREIVALYHELMPANPVIRDWTPARADALRVRWNEDPKRQDLDWWRRFFAYCAARPFLTGRAHSPGRKPFTPGLEWLLKAENFAKIREGRYDDAECYA